MRSLVVALLFSVLALASLRAEDTREAVDLPPEIREAFMAEMRAHMDTLDDIVTAIGEGDFAEAAFIADVRLDFGHRIWEQMAELGMTAEEIAAMKKKMRAMGMATGKGSQGGGMGKGFGRYMPPEFRTMGRSFHEAGGELAKVLKSTAKPPAADDYRRVMEALAAVTTACRGCHDAYRVR